MKKIVYFVFSIGIIIGCIIPALAISDFPYDLMLQPTDLPDGFSRSDGLFPEVPDGYSHAVGFLSDSKKFGMVIGHQITIYSDVSTAIENISYWEDSWFTPTWSVPAIIYEPIDTNDYFKLECLEAVVNNQPMLSCRWLQQHNNLIVLAHANIDDEELKYEQFINMLKSLDARLSSNGELVPTPSNWYEE